MVASNVGMDASSTDAPAFSDRFGINVLGVDK